MVFKASAAYSINILTVYTVMATAAAAAYRFWTLISNYFPYRYELNPYLNFTFY